MSSNIFVEYVKEKLPRKDDQDLFKELYTIYQEGGKDALQEHLKKMIEELEG
jgi:hypothetical protein